MSTLSDSKIAACGFLVGAALLFRYYMSSLEYLYKITLKSVMNCRQETKLQNPAELEVLCGKIPHISEHDY